MPVEIADWNDLDNVRNDLDGDYVLVNDLDSETDGYAGIGDDFEPIGFIENDEFTSEFGGSFDGDGFEISDLVIEYDGLSDGDIAFVASTDGGSLIENLSVNGSVTVTNSGGSNYGGLVGLFRGGTIQNCVSHVDVTAPDGNRVGGLVANNEGTVTDSYATGSVEGDQPVGGLVGQNDDTVTDCYATGSVEADERVGGLVGDNNGIVTDSYATGSVEGDNVVGGLVGREASGDSGAGIRRCYSYGTVTGSGDVGGFCGRLGAFLTALGYIFDSYVDIDESGQDDAIGSIDEEGESDVTELSTSEMQGSEVETNMDGFDFANVWDAVLESDDDTSADGYPILLALNRENQLEEQGIFQDLQPPEPPTNLQAELL